MLGHVITHLDRKRSTPVPGTTTSFRKASLPRGLTRILLPSSEAQGCLFRVGLSVELNCLLFDYSYYSPNTTLPAWKHSKTLYFLQQ